MFRENNTFLFFAKCNLLQILSREDILNTIFGIYNLVAKLQKQMPHYFVLETKITLGPGLFAVKGEVSTPPNSAIFLGKKSAK